MHPSQLQIKDFTYELPIEKIVNYPLQNRDESKLLVYNKNNITTTNFKNLVDYLPENCTLILNNTKVIQARLHFFTSANQAIEVFCLEPDDAYKDVSAAMLSTHNVRYKCLVGNLKKWKEESLVLTKNEINLTLTQVKKTNEYVLIDFVWTSTISSSSGDLCFAEVLEKIGILPIPPYIKRDSEALDTIRYQTVYATHKGSVAAPTAGLHFTEAVFKSLKTKNITNLNVTLHVGAGTFKPVKTDTIGEHTMHAEWIDVDITTIKHLSLNQQVIAVGTTSLRTIETLYWMGVKASINKNASLLDIEIKQWDAYELKSNVSVPESLSHLMDWLQTNNLQSLVCKTQILIAPPYKFKIVKAIITNFHQPQSTLLLLISAVVGNNWKTIYNYALQNNFRFLSYGDSSLLFTE